MADDAAPLMHVDWLRTFEAWRQELQTPIEINVEQIVGGGQPLTRTNDTNVTLTLGGTPASALFKPVSLTLGWSGTLAPSRGGTGLGAFAVGDLLYADTTSTLARLADVAIDAVLVSGGVNTAPAYSSTPTLRSVTLESATGITVPDSVAAVQITGGTIAADLRILEIHNSFAVGADLYTHAAAGFRAPYINFYKSRGTQASPTVPTLTGYELDSIGGINFGGWSGSAYIPGAAIYSQVDQDWSGASNHGSHLSIYGSANGGANVNQLVQFGGLDPVDAAALNSAGVTSNILFYRPIAWSGNSVNNPALFFSSSPPMVLVRSANNAADAALTASGFTASAVAALTTAAESWVGPSTTAGVYFKGGFVGFGTVTPTAPLTLVTSSSTVPFEIHNNFANGIDIYSHDNAAFRGPTINIFKSRGTQGSPTGVSSGDTLGYLQWGGYDTAAYVGGAASIIVTAGETWSGSVRGTTTTIRNTKTGSSGAGVAITISGSLNNVGVGVSSATAGIQIRAGAAAANNAPLKFNSGTLLTTAEAGALEFLTDDFFATITTGAARKAFMLDDGTRLTSGKVPVASTNGRLIDGPTLTTVGVFRATGRSTAQVAAVATVATFTLTAADASFLVNCNVNVTTSTAHNFNVQVDYTDETNTARTLTLTVSQLAGTLITAITNLTGAGPYEGVPVQIRCKASTAITVKTTGTFTTVTYNVEGSILQVS